MDPYTLTHQYLSTCKKLHSSALDDEPWAMISGTDDVIDSRESMLPGRLEDDGKQIFYIILFFASNWHEFIAVKMQSKVFFIILVVLIFQKQ